MNTVDNALERIARAEGITSSKVRREIELVLAAARRDPDPAVRARWESIPHAGEYPTAEEVIGYISGKIRM